MRKRNSALGYFIMQFPSGIFHSQALKRLRGLGSGSCIIQFAGNFHSKALERRRDGNTSFTAAIFLVRGRLADCCIICVQVLYRRPSPVISDSFGCSDIRSFTSRLLCSLQAILKHFVRMSGPNKDFCHAKHLTSLVIELG